MILTVQVIWYVVLTTVEILILIGPILIGALTVAQQVKNLTTVEGLCKNIGMT